jgi:hypothetical protein
LLKVSTIEHIPHVVVVEIVNLISLQRAEIFGSLPANIVLKRLYKDDRFIKAIILYEPESQWYSINQMMISSSLLYLSRIHWRLQQNIALNDVSFYDAVIHVFFSTRLLWNLDCAVVVDTSKMLITIFIDYSGLATLFPSR